jgi:hypothetical protein
VKAKKKILITGIFAVCALIVIIIASIGIYNARHPLTLRYDFVPEDVARIEIFDGSTGNRYTITDEEAVLYVARDIQSKTYTRGENVKGHSGFVYSTTFYDKSDTMLWCATINSADTLVDYHYVYKPDSPLDFTYIQKNVQVK